MNRLVSSLVFGFFWISAGAIAGFGAPKPAEPLITDVFISGTDGYHTYRIPAIVVTTNGTVLACCEGRKNSRSDTGKIALLLKRSTDGGKTWSPHQIVRSDGDNVCGNPAPVVDETTGFVWLLMTWNLGADGEREINNGTSKDTRRVFVTHSADDGVTWAKPQEITASVKRPDWRWYATGPVNGIQLTRGAHKGRLVIPCNHTALDNSGKSVSRSHVIYSDDHGATWQLGGSEDELTNESTVVERADGSLLHNMRSYNKKNRRAVATSNDGGATWSHVKLDDPLIEPVCQASIFRYSWPENGGRSRILFSNPASTKRETLTIRISYDEGATWPISKLLHPGPSAYSCLAALPDKCIACLFECGDKSAYEKISLARIPLAWLEKQ
jgi:sialidase-1